MKKDIEELEEIVKRQKPKYYRVYIKLLIGKNWAGEVLYGSCIIKSVKPENMENIKADPLQDYMSYGFQNILYVELSAYPIYEIEHFRIEHFGSEISIEKYNEHYDKKYINKYIEEIYDDYIEPEIIEEW